MPRKVRAKRKAETPPPGEERRGASGPDLGYGEDTGHPGGAQPLEAKSETEKEHD